MNIPHLPIQEPGREFEVGLGEGEGYTVNSPVLPGRGDDEYKRLIMQDLVPAFKKFNPEFILLSAGFDAHESDMMSGTNLSTEGYDFISEVIMNLVKRCAGGRVVSVLEGGYNLDISAAFGGKSYQVSGGSQITLSFSAIIL